MKHAFRALIPVLLLLLSSSRAWATIAFVSASSTACVNSASGTSSITCTLAASTTANNTVYVNVAIRTTTSTVSTIIDSGGSSYSLISSCAVNNGTNARDEIWATGVGAAKASTTVTVNLGAGSKFVMSVEEYSGVLQQGACTTSTSNAANPSQSLTTTAANDFCVGGFSGQSTNTFTAGTGNLRANNVTSGGSAASNVGGAAVDNSVASSGGTCTTSVTNADTVWALAITELVSVAASCGGSTARALLGVGCR